MQYHESKFDFTNRSRPAIKSIGLPDSIYIQSPKNRTNAINFTETTPLKKSSITSFDSNKGLSSPTNTTGSVLTSTSYTSSPFNASN